MITTILNTSSSRRYIQELGAFTKFAEGEITTATMNEKRADESPYKLDKIRDLINRVQQSIVDIETQTNTIEQVDENSRELDEIRDLINRVQQSIVDVETQKNKIEWLRLYFALYFLQNGKSLDPSVKDFKK